MTRCTHNTKLQAALLVQAVMLKAATNLAPGATGRYYKDISAEVVTNGRLSRLGITLICRTPRSILPHLFRVHSPAGGERSPLAPPQRGWRLSLPSAAVL